MSVSEPLVQASLLGEAIDRGPVAVFVADDTMRYVAVNDYACRLLGYTRPELLELKVTDVARDAGSTDEYTQMMRERSRTGIASLTCKDGSEVRVCYRATETAIARMPVYVSVAWPAD